MRHGPTTTAESLECAILLGTKNGAPFVEEQLQSFIAQSHCKWRLYVSDDQSTDETLGIIRRFAETHKLCISIRQGPNDGLARNFITLAQDPSINAAFYAFSDQDDVWFTTKLERAIEALRQIPPSLPAMYCSRTEIVDEHQNHRGYSPIPNKPPSFKNALVQNICAGNTMVFNCAAKRLLEAAGGVQVVLHDWWVYLAVSGAGGIVIYDPHPTLKYRQHANNMVGFNRSLKARALRLKMRLKGRQRGWNETNISALRKISALLNLDSQKALEHFATARSKPSAVARVYYLLKSGVYRQAVSSQLALILAACIKRI